MFLFLYIFKFFLKNKNHDIKIIKSVTDTKNRTDIINYFNFL